MSEEESINLEFNSLSLNWGRNILTFSKMWAFTEVDHKMGDFQVSPKASILRLKSDLKSNALGVFDKIL